MANKIVLNFVTDITSSLIEYHRENNICSGIGVATIVLKPDAPTLPEIYEFIQIYENDVPIGLYNVASIARSIETGAWDIACQDNSKKLVDWWIPTQYKLSYPTTCRYWIEHFLEDCGVETLFTVDDEDYGGILNEDTSFGPTNLYDLMVMLLQYSGWYMYFDGNGKCVIGDLLDTDMSEEADYVLDDNQILSVTTRKTDKLLRNRAVVWGKVNPITKQWIFADKSRMTPWNYDEDDKRAVVIGNSYINTYSAAYSMAQKVLNEFTKPNYEKEIEFADFKVMKIGDLLSVVSRGFTGKGLITSLSSSYSSKGRTSIVTLDQRCPRLFAYYSYISQVCIGTRGDGVWRKPLHYHVWSDISSGIDADDKNIVDLSINADLYTTVADTGQAYVKFPGYTQWQKFNPVLIYLDTGDPVSEPVAVACSINKATNEFYFLFNKEREDGKRFCWIIMGTTLSHYTIKPLRDSSYNDQFLGRDIEHYGQGLAVAAESFVSNIKNVNTGAYSINDLYFANVGRTSNLSLYSNEVTSFNYTEDPETYSVTNLDAISYKYPPITVSGVIFSRLAPEHTEPGKLIYKYNIDGNISNILGTGYSMKNFCVKDNNIVYALCYSSTDTPAARYVYKFDYSTSETTLITTFNWAGQFISHYSDPDWVVPPETREITYSLISNLKEPLIYVNNKLFTAYPISCRGIGLAEVDLGSSTVNIFTGEEDENHFTEDSVWSDGIEFIQRWEYIGYAVVRNYLIIGFNRAFGAFSGEGLSGTYSDALIGVYNMATKKFSVFAPGKVAQTINPNPDLSTKTVAIGQIKYLASNFVDEKVYCVMSPYFGTAGQRVGYIDPVALSYTELVYDASKSYALASSKKKVYAVNTTDKQVLYLPDLSLYKTYTNSLFSNIMDDNIEGFVTLNNTTKTISVIGSRTIDIVCSGVTNATSIDLNGTTFITRYNNGMSTGIIYPAASEAYKNCVLKEGKIFFDQFLYTDTPYRLDASLDYPLVIFGENQTLREWSFNELLISTNYKATGFHRFELDSGQELMDVRSFDGDTIYPDSGIIRYVGYLTKMPEGNYQLSRINIESDDYVEYYRDFDDVVVNRLETSNYYKILESGAFQEPYIFVATSGVDPDFYQKDQNTDMTDIDEYIVRNNNLPDSEITIIRLDDIV